jgi:hypothetical protein
MSFEHILEPPRRLQYAWDRMQPENMELRILKMGETYSVGPLGEDRGKLIRLARLAKISVRRIVINCDDLNTIFGQPWSDGVQDHKLTPF